MTDIIRIDNAKQFKELFPRKYGLAYISKNHVTFFPNGKEITFPLFITTKRNSPDEATLYGSYIYVETTEEKIREEYEEAKKDYEKLLKDYEKLLRRE